MTPDDYNPLSPDMTAESDLIQFADETEPDILALIRLRDEQGEEALTDSEYALLAQFEQAATADKGDPSEHYANLAEFIDDGERKRIAQKVLDWVVWDEESRSEWQEMEKKGIRALGVSPNVDGGASFKGASTVVHPLLGEACVQFAARALDNLWPAGGPVKTVVLGKADEQRLQQATRVEQFMNYQYAEMMPGAYEVTDRMLVRLPLSGSVFIKGYFDPVNGVSRSMVEPADFIVPYRATDLITAQRYTERILMSQNDVRKRQVAGLYRDIDLIDPWEDTAEQEREVVIEEIRDTEGREDQAFTSDDHRRTLFECYCELDIPGFEDKKNGKPTGIELPYIVTVDKDSQEVLSIYRNWKPSDPQKRKVIYHIHYRFMPGLGFYGYGLYHWIGGLAKTATGALRALLDAAAFANLQGGFRSKDSGLKNGDITVGPGEWPELDADAEDLRKAFFPLPYKEPSVVLFQLLGHLEQLGQRFAGTTEAMVGEGSQNTPVGTMLARIEQGGKVYTAIQSRLHQAQGQEFKLVAWLDSLYLPPEYPYAVQGEDRTVMRSDFDERMDVVPVSDPRYVSNVQRYFMAQASLEIAATKPELYDWYKLHKRAQESLRIQDVDEILPPPDKMIERRDPVTEGAAILMGRPIKAFPEQDHGAHLAVHQAQLAMLPAPMQKGPQAAALQAHIVEHLANAYLLQMQAMTGVPFQLPTDEQSQPLPPQVENQIAMLAAQASQAMTAQTPQAPDPMTAEQQRKDAAVQADIARKDVVAAADLRRADIEAVHGMQMKERETMQQALSRNREQEMALYERTVQGQA